MPGERKKRVAIADVMLLLGAEYGPFEWEPRFDPASELVYTILSQHTSDINSERAFKNLMATFGSLEDIASASVGDIEDAIRMGGLAKVKAPRIKAVLNQIFEELGSFDLMFLKDMPLDEAKAWQELGAGYLSIENRQAGLTTAGEHIEAMRRFKDATDFRF